ncbi:MAG TPA: ABC transporter ATP-binding protein [Candidatus Diapherotrites archaeon]|uniref:ABC transporter ATP-binding protein n=1 Tax=Candidatus Iainarchaeum sp. TaxID=3101447 RepID=A0A7J4IX17_9ARCH|nr:ABC transporter ATP-binding protein [Candidatus Diapherotrites archaeon]
MTRKHVAVKGLNVDFEKPVLKNVFLDMKKGEFVSIVGRSGTGKSTFLNSLAGFMETEGEIHGPGRKAIVSQNYSLFPWMSVEENIAFGLEKQDRERVGKIIRRIELEGKEKSYPYQLSGGQQQRVAIGRAIAYKPELLLLDEPFANLDSYTRITMQEWLNEVMRENKTTTLLVTHDVDEAILLGDRVLVLKDKSFRHEYNVPFNRPRDNEIRYLPIFQELRREILKSL